jgi:hypothetical protein
MEAMRQSWTDDRLDDFRAETKERFDKVDEHFDKVEDQVKEMRGEMNTRFNALEARFDALQRVMIQFSGGLIVVLVGFVVTQV